jgi:MFS family permease
MSPMDSTSRGGWKELLGPGHIGPITVLAGGVALYATNVFLTTSLLPSAIEDIGGERIYAWNATFFLVASVVSSMLVSRLLVRRGAVAAYLIGFAVFAAGTAICAVSPTMEMLLAGRAVQGFGGGLLAGLGFAVIRSALPERLWTRGIGVISAMWAVGNLAGPAVGGAFAQIGAWRWAFVVLAVLSAAGVVLTPRALGRARPAERGDVAVPVVSLTVLALATTFVSVAGIVPRGTLTGLTLVAAAILVIAFIVRDRRATRRVLPMTTYAPHSPLRWVYLSITILAIGSTSETFLPLFGQRLGDLSPLAAGFFGAALSLGWSIAQIVSTSVHSEQTIARLRVIGPGVLAIGLAAYGLLQTDDPSPLVIWLWVASLGVAGAGIGMAFAHFGAAAMASSADPVEAGKAAAGINTVQLIANAFGTAFAGVLVNLGQPSTVDSARYLVLAFAALAVVGVLTARRSDPGRRADVPGLSEPEPDRRAA